MQGWLIDPLASGVALIHRKLRSDRAYRETQPKPPKPLPHRRRALSATPYDQTLNSKCQLLNRLPPEIRLEIYKYVLGSNLLHLVRKETKISHVRCRASSSTDFVRTCRPSAASTEDRILPGSSSNGNLALVKTCRQVYHETIDVLYATNVFDVDDPRLFIHFSQSIRPQCMARITTLQVYCPMGCPPWDPHTYAYPVKNPPYDKLTWREFWHVIRVRMAGLTDLSVCLGVRFGISQLRVTDEWAEALLEIRGLKRFDFDVLYVEDHKADTARLKVAQFRQHLREVTCAQA